MECVFCCYSCWKTPEWYSNLLPPLSIFTPPPPSSVRIRPVLPFLCLVPPCDLWRTSLTSASTLLFLYCPWHPCLCLPLPRWPILISVASVPPILQRLKNLRRKLHKRPCRRKHWHNMGSKKPNIPAEDCVSFKKKKTVKKCWFGLISFLCKTNKKKVPK